MSIKMRQLVEKEIAGAVIDALLKAGFVVSVDNGDNSGGVASAASNFQYELANSTNKKEILKSMFLTDEDRLYTNKLDEHGNSTSPYGWVYFIYGNDGWDVITDYTVNLESLIGEGTEVQKVIDKYAD